MSDTSFVKVNDSAVDGGMRRRTLLGGGAASAALAFALGRLGEAHAAPVAAPTSGWGSGIRLRFFAGGNAGDAFASIVFNGAQQAQSDLGVAVDYVFSGWDVNMMTDQLRQAIAAQPDGIAMMGHPGDDALLPLAQQAHDAGVLMEYQNVDQEVWLLAAHVRLRRRFRDTRQLPARGRIAQGRRSLSQA